MKSYKNNRFLKYLLHLKVLIQALQILFGEQFPQIKLIDKKGIDVNKKEYRLQLLIRSHV